MPAVERLADLTQDAVTQHRALDFCRYLSCLYEAPGPRARERFLERWKGSVSRELMTKAAVAAGNTTDATWAQPLYGLAPLVDGFLAVARSASLLGRIPGLRLIPFHAKVPTQTQDASYAWIGQGMPKPTSKLAFDDGVTLGPTKCLGIVVVTDELLKVSVSGMEAALRDTLIAGLTAFTDKSFLDPTSTTIPDVRPGAITSGTTPIAGTGDLPKDVGTLLDAFYTARPGATAAVLLMGGGNAAKLTGVAGVPGSAYGLPIVVTEAAGNNVIAIDPQAVFVADNGLEVDISRQAAIEMVDNPAAPTAATIVTDLWSRNLAGLKVERFVNWQAITGAVKYLTVT